MYNIEKIKKDLKENLSEYRYNHSLNVAEIAMELATIYNVDREKAYIAGLVHDIAKEFTDEENEYYIAKYNLPRFEEKFKKVTHSYVGAVFLKEKYDMDDEICNAVMFHSLASINMSLLDKIIFVADKIEPGKDYPGIEEERILAREDLDKAILICLENNFKKLTNKGKTMHSSSIKVLNYLKKKTKKIEYNF